MEPYIKQELIQPGLAEITFFHPAHNSLPGDLLTKLTKTIVAAGEDPAVEVIILKSGGDRTFCAGASFNELVAIEDLEAGKLFFTGFANVMNALRKCPKLVIGRVQGKAVGGGVGLAAATDYCLATQYAAIKLSELNIGIGPFVVGPVIQRKIGLSAMSQLAINFNEFRTAEWARDKGLYADIFDTAEAMDQAILDLAQSLMSTSPEARRRLKASFWQGTERWDMLLAERAEISGRLVLSDYTKAALKKFQ